MRSALQEGKTCYESEVVMDAFWENQNPLYTPGVARGKKVMITKDKVSRGTAASAMPCI
jgi:hypothetical protein